MGRPLKWACLAEMAMLLAAPLAVFASSSGGELEFAGVTSILSDGAGYLRFSLPLDSEVSVAAIETDSDRALLMVLGVSSIGLFRFKAGDDWAGNPNESSVELTAGTYFVYVVSDGPMTTTLRFSALSGRLDVSPLRTMAAGFLRLAPSGIGGDVLAASTLPVAQRFTGTQPFVGSAISAFMAVTETLVVEAETAEYRWSNPQGVTRCFGGGGGVAVGGVPNTHWVGFLSIANHGASVTLEYFRNGASLTTRHAIYGIWVERAPEHLPPPEVEAHEPLLWEMDGIAPDVGCVRSNVPLLLGGVVP